MVLDQGVATCTAIVPYVPPRSIPTGIAIGSACYTCCFAESNLAIVPFVHDIRGNTNHIMPPDLRLRHTPTRAPSFTQGVSVSFLPLFHSPTALTW